MSDNRAKQRLYEAVRILVGAGPVQERLGDAGVLLGLPPIDIPPRFASELRSVLDALAIKSGHVSRQLSDEEGAELARRIVSLYTDVMGGL